MKYKEYVSWRVLEFHGSNATTQGDGEYTTSIWGNSYKEESSTRKGFFYDICLGICEHGRFAPYIAEEPDRPSII